MTVIVVAATIWEAAYGEVGRVLIGLAVSTFGIFVVALSGPDNKENR
jgi:hypothetical protein